MRCYACQRNLNDYESTLRSAVSGEFLDMCKKCLTDLDIITVQNKSNPDEYSPDDDDLDIEGDTDELN